MKYFSLALATLGTTIPCIQAWDKFANANYNIPFGYTSNNGRIIYDDASHFLKIILKKKDNVPCAELMPSVDILFKPNPLADWDKFEQQRNICLWKDTRDITLNINTFEKSYFDGESEYCESTNIIDDLYYVEHLKEFNTLRYMDDVNQIVSCTTLIDGALDMFEAQLSGDHDWQETDTLFTMFRSNNRREFAFALGSSADNVFGNNGGSRNYMMRWFKNRKCSGDTIDTWTGTLTLNEFEHVSADKNKLWNAKSVEIALSNGNQQCFLIKPFGSGLNSGWNPSGRKIVLGKDKYRSLRMSVVQDNPFAPSVYRMRYNNVDGFDNSGDGALGTYHVHTKARGDNTSPTDCGSDLTGGHWNPYGVTKPYGPYDMDFEIGDLGNRYGYLFDGYDVEQYDYNLPLFGVNKINHMSLVVHENSGDRKVCWDFKSARYFGLFETRLTHAWKDDEFAAKNVA